MVRHTILFIDGTVGAVVGQLTAALHFTGWTPAQNKYLVALQIVVLGLIVCVCEIICV